MQDNGDEEKDGRISNGVASSMFLKMYFFLPTGSAGLIRPWLGGLAEIGLSFIHSVCFCFCCCCRCCFALLPLSVHVRYHKTRFVVSLSSVTTVINAARYLRLSCNVGELVEALSWPPHGQSVYSSHEVLLFLMLLSRCSDLTLDHPGKSCHSAGFR